MIPAVYTILSLFIGLKVNNIYMSYATKKVDEIKISNPDKSSVEIYTLCEKKGRTVNPLLIVILLSMVLTLSLIIYTETKTIEKKQVVRC